MPNPADAQTWLTLAEASATTVSKVHADVKATIPDVDIFEARLIVSMASPSCKMI
jgi:hypothetical protein